MPCFDFVAKRFSSKGKCFWKKCYIQCGVWNQMKIWSSHLLDNLSNCLMNLKNSGDSTGFEPMTSAMPVQCSNQLSYEVTQWRPGQFFGSCFPVKGMSYERNVINAFELSPAKSHFPFTRISVSVCSIFQCEPESMVICIIITNKQMRCDLSKFKLTNKVQHRYWPGKCFGRCNRSSEFKKLWILKSKTQFLDRNVLCLCANFCTLKHGKMEV